MKNIPVYLAVVAAAMAVSLGSVFLAGCEDAAGVWPLNVEPSYVDLSALTPVTVTDTNGNSTTTYGSVSNGTLTQTFTVTGGLRELSLPLTWRVSDASLGNIAAAGGYSASYTRTDARGDNSVIVEDQYGAQGVATVHQ